MPLTRGTGSGTRSTPSTRWGTSSPIRPFFDRLSTGGIGKMPASPECGYQHLVFIGEDWKFSSARARR